MKKVIIIAAFFFVIILLGPIPESNAFFSASVQAPVEIKTDENSPLFDFWISSAGALPGISGGEGNDFWVDFGTVQRQQTGNHTVSYRIGTVQFKDSGTPTYVINYQQDDLGNLFIGNLLNMDVYVLADGALMFSFRFHPAQTQSGTYSGFVSITLNGTHSIQFPVIINVIN